MSRNLAANLVDTAERHGDHIAIKLDEFELNYQLLNEASARVAGLLESKGVGPGDRVGIMLPNDNLGSNVDTILDALIEIQPDAVVLGALPFFHSFGQTCGLNSCVKAGGTLTLLPRFDPDKALEIIERDKVTIFEGVPTMYV